MRANTTSTIVIITRFGNMHKEEFQMSEARKIETEEEMDELSGLPEVMVLDDASAEMILRQLKEAEDQYDRMSAWYKAQTQKLKDIRDRTRAWAEACLRPYMEMVPTTGKKIRSYEMPGGVMKLAKQDPEYVVNDDELVPWLKQQKRDDLIKVTEEARWGELKKEIQIKVLEDGRIGDNNTGEIIPGVTATIREDKFSIKCK